MKRQKRNDHIDQDKHGLSTSLEFNWSQQMLQTHISNLFESGWKARDIVSIVNSELIKRGYHSTQRKGA